MNTKFLYPRGSEWRKWDLQVQTIIDDGYISISKYWDDLKLKFPDKCNDLIKAMGNEDLIKKFDSKEYFLTSIQDSPQIKSYNYAKLLLNFVNIFNKDIGVIGVTDHNYDQDFLIDALVDQAKNSNVKIIPGVEINVQGVHKLVFFSTIPYEQKTYSIGIKLFLSKLGINNKKENNTLTVSNRSYKDVLHEINNIGAVLIYPHCNSSNGLFEGKGKTDRTHLANQFNEQPVNILQSKNKSSAENTTLYIDSNQALTSKHVFTLGSDSRCLKDIFSQDNDKNYCWIKADPTFEGLKQILYEADDRVKIQESKPEERESYQIIESVKFDHNDFPKEEILLNKNLTVIIGGKSTGKSVLLRNIAEAIDAKEVSNRITVANLQKYQTEIKDFSVKWCDGQESKKVNSGTNKKIIYIPQSYLNRLIVDEKEKETPIHKIAEDIIKQNNLVKKSFYELYAQQREVEKNIEEAVNSLFYIEEEIKNLSEAIRKIGDKQGIEIEINKLEQEIKNDEMNSGISSEDKKKYDDLKNAYEKLNYQKTTNQKDLENLNLLKGKELFVAPNLLSLSEEVQMSLKTEYESLIQKYLQQWRGKIDDIVNTIKENDVELDKSIALNTKERMPLLEKVNKTESLKNKNESLEKEKQKLKEITEKEVKLKAEEEKFNTKITQIVEGNSKFFDSFLSAKNEILKQENISNDIDFDISIEFKENFFKEDFVDKVLYRNSSGDFEVKLDSYKFTSNDNLKETIEKSIYGIINDKLKLKNISITKKEAIKKLVQNWFIFDYKIKYESDDISTMSPGKKSFIILKLLIELSNDRCPILLDQPEDDLDNRSIYNDLVKFIKDKKKNRQIIIVTHNPNLAVGADAECIIVANQNGSKSKNKKYKFEYITGSLENQFEDKNEFNVLYKQGIRQHVCDILEGGKDAFEKREKKYNLNKSC
jgi:predicted ATPase